MPKLPNSVQTAFFVVIFAFLSLYIFTKLFGPIPFSVNSVTTTKTDLFSVNAEGKASGIPDTAQVSLGVTKSASTVEDAKNQVNEVANNITSDLKGMGIEEKNIKTTDFSVNPDYDYTTPGSQKVKGYTVSQTLSVKITPLEKANKVVDAATARGANNLGGIQFMLNDDAQMKLEDQAREEAISKAKTKAESIAKAAGIHLGRIVNVMESPSNPPVMFNSLKAADASGEVRNQTELQPGQNTVTVNVSLSYETY